MLSFFTLLSVTHKTLYRLTGSPLKHQELEFCAEDTAPSIVLIELFLLLLKES